MKKFEISAFMSISVRAALEELLPVFEKASGHKILPTWSASAVLNERLLAGEPVDVLISTRSVIDALIKDGRVVAGSDFTVGRSGVGVAVKQGAAKPDISTPDALKRALLEATAISYSKPEFGGASGVHFAKVLERLGIASEVNQKTKFPPKGGFAGEFLLSGEADLAIQQIAELAAVKGTEIVGPLPGDLQLVSPIVAGMTTNARQTDAAKTFLEFLRSPQALAMLKAKGFEI